MYIVATLYLIEILHQTTTRRVVAERVLELYLIEILHQTTTAALFSNKTLSLYLIEILHQTTTHSYYVYLHQCCILLKFYIKPQRWVRYLLDSSLFCRFFQPENRMRKLRRSEFDEFFVFQRTKILFFQKNSNCCGISGFARSLLPQKLRMSPYCLSVTDRILVNPAGGIDRRTRLM